ncbi:hypothetical protein [Microbulbifer sp.]|uniref:hypothetical protein n=1 Tax=Microbulbifer sp. TaxID=1908541 RepID=UPI003F2CDCED
MKISIAVFISGREAQTIAVGLQEAGGTSNLLGFNRARLRLYRIAQQENKK